MKGRFSFVLAWLQISGFVPAIAYMWNHQQPQTMSRGPAPAQDFSHARFWQHETPAPLLPARPQPVMHSPQLPQYHAPHMQPQSYHRPLAPSPTVTTAPVEVEPIEVEVLTTTPPRPLLRHPPPAYHVQSAYQRPPNPPAAWKTGFNYGAQQEMSAAGDHSKVRAFHPLETQLSVQSQQVTALTAEEKQFLRNLSSLTPEQKLRLARLPPTHKRAIQSLLQRAMLLERQKLQQASEPQHQLASVILQRAPTQQQSHQQKVALHVPVHGYSAHMRELQENKQTSRHWQSLNEAHQSLSSPYSAPVHSTERPHIWQHHPAQTTPKGELEIGGSGLTPLIPVRPAFSGQDYVSPAQVRVGSGPLRPAQPQPAQPQPAHVPIGVHAHHLQPGAQTYVAQHVPPAAHGAQPYSQHQQALSSHSGWGSYSPATSDSGSPHDIFSSRFNVQAFQHGYMQAFMTTAAPPTPAAGSGSWGSGDWGQAGFNMNVAVPATTLPPTTTTTPSHLVAVNPVGIQAGFYIGPNPKSLDPSKQNRPKPTTQIIETMHQGSAADLAGGFFGNTPPPPTTTTTPLPGRDGNHMAGWLGFNVDPAPEPPAPKARNEVSNQGFQSFFPVPGVDTQSTNQVSAASGQTNTGKASPQTVQNALSTLLQSLKGNPQLLTSVLSQIGSNPARK